MFQDHVSARNFGISPLVQILNDVRIPVMAKFTILFSLSGIERDNGGPRRTDTA